MLDATPRAGENSGVDPELNVTYDEFCAILKELEDKKHSIGEAGGELRSALKSKLDQYGWHKGALAMIRTIEDMSSTKRCDFLRTFEAMFDLMIAKKWRDEMVNLIPDEDAEND